MKLIRQASLAFQEGNSDKVYEVDLVEVSAGKYVVNFRYGRRGSTLREGTKTSSPVSLTDAEKIYDKLVTSKTSKGYKEASEPSLTVTSETPEPTPTPEPEIPSDPRRAATLKRIREGKQSDSNWSLSRAAWRAGELSLHEAEKALLRHLRDAEPMLAYSICFALSQCGSRESVPVLQSVLNDRSCPKMVERMASVAMLELAESAEHEKFLGGLYQQLPDSIVDLVGNGPAEELQAAVEAHLLEGNYQAYEILETLYLIGTSHAREVLLNLLAEAPLQPNFFQRIRHIYKMAEARRDAEMFGLLAYRFETTRHMFKVRAYYWTDEVRRNHMQTFDKNAKRAFSDRTKGYLRRRTWRTLKRLGELDDERYVEMAYGVLLELTDEDEIQPYQRYHYFYEGNRWRSGTVHFDKFSPYWALNQILYGNSPRYVETGPGEPFRCVSSYQPGGREPEEREEEFPHLWDQRPDLLVDLLLESRCQIVHRFAVKALRANEQFCEQMSLQLLITLLRVSYPVTTQFAFEIAKERYDENNPSKELILALANCAYRPARLQAAAWIDSHRAYLLEDNEFIVALVSSPHESTRQHIWRTLKSAKLSDEKKQVLVGRLIALMQYLGSDESAIVADVATTLLDVFGELLKTIGADVIRDLLGHSSPEVQKFAGDLLLAHETLSKQPPVELVQALLTAEHPEVREIGVRIIGQLPDEILLASPEMLVNLCRHSLEDIRNLIRPTVKRLADANHSFGETVTTLMVDAILVPGAPEGVPSHTARVLIDDLSKHLHVIPSAKVWQLLQSRSMPAQEVGGVLLQSISADELSVKEIAKLSHHQILSVREASWKFYDDNVERMRSDPEAASVILDSKWDDSRDFGFRYFREHFLEHDVLTPTILIGICDSVRPDVQRFGRDMIARVLSEESGEEYALKLSEHPTEAMQLFASNFLEEHASDNAEKLRQLAPYFQSVLSRVNKGRVSKERAFRFLETEALKSEEAASVIAPMLARQSATIAIGDRAKCIEVMLKIHTKYPSIEVPIEVQPVEVRDGV